MGPLRSQAPATVPRAQLDAMVRRLGTVETREVTVRRQLEYEEMNHRLLAFLVAAEAKLKAWTDKYGYQPEVEGLLHDYRVRKKLLNIEFVCSKST